MTWLHLPSVTLTQGSIAVTVNNTFETEHIQVGDGLLIGQFAMVEIAGVHSQQLTLKTPWPNAKQTAVAASIVPTAADFQMAARLLREATTVTHGNFAAMERWWTEVADVLFVGYDGTNHTVRSAKKMDADVQALEAKLQELMQETLPRINPFIKDYIAANQEKYAAAGMVHSGKHSPMGSSTEKPINEGMYTMLNTPNAIGMGRDYADAVGTSKTGYAMTHIAGFVSKMLNVNDAGVVNRCRFLLPEAAAGYEDFDSATGVSTNYLTDVDPKYGNSAEQAFPSNSIAARNEAVSRAFEGDIHNGDIRLGITGWNSQGGKITAQGNTLVYTHINGQEGFFTSEPSRRVTYPSGTECFYEYYVDNPDGATLRINMSGSGIPEEKEHTGSGYFSGTFTVQNSTDYPEIRVEAVSPNSATVTLHHFCVRKVKTEVVTDRHDGIFLEQFATEITQSRPMVWPYGKINSLATSMSGQNTIAAPSQYPDSFFANGDAQGERGKGVDWFAADVFTQGNILADWNDHHISITPDGKVIQWACQRPVAVKGAGNGDWQRYDVADTYGSASANSKLLQYAQSVGWELRVQPQGNRDTPIGGSRLNTNQTAWYGGQYHPNATMAPDIGLGVWGAGGASCGYEGRCYLYVIGFAKRLNQGAAHPLNESGTRKINGGAPPFTTNYWWYAKGAKGVIKSSKDCFIVQPDLNNGGTGGGANLGSGNMASGVSGRDDGGFYDAIEASGHGGITDYRMTAWDITPYMGEIWQKILSRMYSGKEKVVRTHFIEPSLIGEGSDPDRARKYAIFSSSNTLGLYLDTSAQVDVGSVVTVVDKTTGEVYRSTVSANNASGYVSCRHVERWDPAIYKWRLFTTTANVYGTGNDVNIAFGVYKNSSVSGGFTTKMLIGDPANILQVDVLKDGGEWTWCPAIPDGTSQVFPYTRKAINSTINRTQTDDFGANWTAASTNVDSVENSLSGIPPATRVFIDTYTAYAKQTKPSTNAKVYQGDDGIGDVVAGGSYQTDQWCLLTESLIGKVVTSADARNRVAYSVLSKTIRQDGVLLDQMSPIHSPIDLGRPSNNSPVVKALPYWHIKNQQMIPHIAFNELVWNDNPTIATLSNVATDMVKGTIYRVPPNTGTAVMDGGIFLCTFSTATDWNNPNWFARADGSIGYVGNNNTHLVPISPKGFGDDDTMRIIDGVGTYNNHYGDSCLYGTHELAIPCGFVKNVATAGEA